MSNQLDNAVFDVDFAKMKTPFMFDGIDVGGGHIDVIVAENEAADARDLKLNALHMALGMVTRDARPLTIFKPNFKVYLSPNVRCVATMGKRFCSDDLSIFLGAQITSYVKKVEGKPPPAPKGVKQPPPLNVVGGVGQNRGVAQQLYDDNRKSHLNPFRWAMSGEQYQAAKTNTMAKAIIVHELGHMLHELSSPNKFWPLKTEINCGPKHIGLASQVSQYAMSNRLEFVAEVFTGLIFGKRYGNAVLAEYVDLGGCPVISEPRTAAPA